jgi:hypothetical protein
MDGRYYRERAERCLLLSAIAIRPEIKDQLRLWAHDFDDLAEDTDRKHARRQQLRKWRHRVRSQLRAPTAA